MNNQTFVEKKKIERNGSVHTSEAYDFNNGLVSCHSGLNTDGASTKRI